MLVANVKQGSQEWLNLRKTKITATDAAVILGASHWKTRVQLYHEKVSDENKNFTSERMQRGLDLEPVARDLFCLEHGLMMEPAVVVKDWAMASLDGIDPDGKHIVEIKCPGSKDHSEALLGKVPTHYYPQIQHQLYVTGLPKAFYYSFDGSDGVTVEVQRDDAFIEKMLEEERAFYDCLILRTPPEPSETDYVEREDDEWDTLATRYQQIKQIIQDMEREEEQVRQQLIVLSGGSNTRGSGISLCQVVRKGNVDYSKIPQLKGVDLDIYRKGNITSWRITT